MFWRERERETRDVNGGPNFLCGQVRVLVVGDTGMLSCRAARLALQMDVLVLGVGKTSLVNLIVKDSSVSRPPQTVGCAVEVKHTTFGIAGSSSSSIKGDTERDFFIELWDVSGHDRYKNCRSIFYSQINGVIFVHDLTQRRTKSSLQKWAMEIATTGTFTAPMENGGPSGLPVPYVVIGNKADIAANEGTGGSSGNLVDIARQWVEKQGLLPSTSSEELPLTQSFPGTGGLIAAAKESRYDKEAVMNFFRLLIKRRYFSDDLTAPSPWSITQPFRPKQRLNELSDSYDPFDRSTSLQDYPLKYNAVPPLPAQRNLTPPPTLYPQQPVSVTDSCIGAIFPHTSAPESSSTRSKRSDINV